MWSNMIWSEMQRRCYCLDVLPNLSFDLHCFLERSCICWHNHKFLPHPHHLFEFWTLFNNIHIFVKTYTLVKKLLDERSQAPVNNTRSVLYLSVRMNLVTRQGGLTLLSPTAGSKPPTNICSGTGTQ